MQVDVKERNVEITQNVYDFNFFDTDKNCPWVCLSFIVVCGKLIYAWMGMENDGMANGGLSDS